MPLASGSKLGTYQIVEPIGSGGMGDVYRARDTKLGRDVAIKVLRHELGSDSERLRRFEQEARSASALNHPNIITIHDVDTRGATPHIVMEYVEGKTLREILAGDPLPLKKLVRLAAQIADGLAKAHSAAIIHRDLKPENVMVTSDGLVKILDFGLAKLMPRDPSFASDLRTMTKLDTASGMVVGTVGYMSPEQAKGRAVDHRSDQFALGLILYELLTGKRLFHRETAAQTLTAIMEEEPGPVARVNPKVPDHLSAIVDRVLAKDPEERYDSTRDLARDLHSVLSSDTAGVSEARPVRRRSRIRTLALLGAAVAIVAVVASLELRERPMATGIESVAVLPLDNLSGDPEQDYFADGMTEALIAQLAQIESLKVISRTSAMRYKQTDKNLPEIARELDVEGVIEGSVLRAADRVRITAQLIHGATDRHLWAGSYERDSSDVLVLQSEVARAIAQEIQVKLSPEEESRLASDRVVDPDAHEAYLKGRHFLYQTSAEALEKAETHFTNALERDPNFALAHTGLADIYVVRAFSGFMPPKDAIPRAKMHALSALERDPLLSEAHNSLGWVGFYDWDWANAESELKQAIELNPNNVQAHNLYSRVLAILGRREEAIQEGRRAIALDPLSLPMQTGFAAILIGLDRTDDAIELCRNVQEMDPNFFWAHFHLWRAFARKSMQEEAFGEYKMAFFAHDREVTEALDQAFRLSGYEGAMSTAADALEAQERSGYATPFYMAVTYAHAGDLNETLAWLERAFEERDPLLAYLTIMPELDELRGDPRYEDLRRRMNFPG